jgi:hypothetical protein
MACATLEDMFALTRGTMDAASKAGIQAHMSSGCKTCAENYRWLTELLAAAAEDDSFDFSEETIAWSVAQFRAASATAPSKIQILARLVFDNLLPDRTIEVRSMAAPAVSRQMLYQAGDYDVDVRLEQFEAALSILILGQIVNKAKKAGELAGLSVEMTRHGSGSVQEDKKFAETDTRGMFRLRDVTPGEYDIVIHVPEGDVSIYAITCRAQ